MFTSLSSGHTRVNKLSDCRNEQRRRHRKGSTNKKLIRESSRAKKPHQNFFLIPSRLLVSPVCFSHVRWIGLRDFDANSILPA